MTDSQNINNNSQGGIIEGQRHSECNPTTGCGEKFIMPSGFVVEAEDGEAVVDGEAVLAYPDDIWKVKGTVPQICGIINSMVGNDNFAPGAVLTNQDKKITIDSSKQNYKSRIKQQDADPNRYTGSYMIFINRKSTMDPKVYTIRGTFKQILSAVNGIHSDVKFEQGGSFMAEGGEVKQQGSQFVKKYESFKEKYPDTILLFQLGDFYETIRGDAEIISKVLDIPLAKTSDGTALAGFKHYDIDSNMRKLVNAGHRVALIQEIQSAGENKKLSMTERMSTEGKFNELNELLSPAVKKTEDCITEHSSAKEYISWLVQKFNSGHIFKNRLEFERHAESLGITTPRDIKELTELAIIGYANNISILSGKTIDLKYNELVEFYNRQPNMTLRTTATILKQQYSTPVPISYILGVWCGMDKDGLFFEPSAGNGMLTIASHPKNFIVNEIDETRTCVLETQGFKKVISQDGTKEFKEYQHYFDAVITNPPFGTWDEQIDGYDIKGLEHAMSIIALNTMKNNGRCAIIIGGHTEFDDRGRVKGLKDKIFLTYLSKFYNVHDTININGQLYTRQGTQYSIRAILINGRKTEPSGFYPLINKELQNLERYSYKQVNNFTELYERVVKNMP